MGTEQRQMGKFRRHAVFLTVIIMSFGMILISDYQKPDCVEAQQCIPDPVTQMQSHTFTNPSNNQGFGCWTFCAVGGLYGINDRGNEGFRVNRGGSCGNGRSTWSLELGSSVNGRYVNCMNF